MSYKVGPMDVSPIADRQPDRLRIVLDEMLQGARSKRGVITVGCQRNKVPFQSFADQIGCNLPPGKAGCRKIPQRSFTARGFIHRQQYFTSQFHIHQEGIVRTPEKLAL